MFCFRESNSAAYINQASMTAPSFVKTLQGVVAEEGGVACFEAVVAGLTQSLFVFKTKIF